MEEEIWLFEQPYFLCWALNCFFSERQEELSKNPTTFFNEYVRPGSTGQLRDEVWTREVPYAEEGFWPAEFFDLRGYVLLRVCACFAVLWRARIPLMLQPWRSM